MKLLPGGGCNMARTRKLGSVHAHGCMDCHTYYQDTCITPNKPEKCLPCRVGGRKVTTLTLNRAPQDCCRALARPVTKDELARYKLVGQIPWLICPVCQRTHPYAVKGRSDVDFDCRD